MLQLRVPGPDPAGMERSLVTARPPRETQGSPSPHGDGEGVTPLQTQQSGGPVACPSALYCPAGAALSPTAGAAQPPRHPRSPLCCPLPGAAQSSRHPDPPSGCLLPGADLSLYFRPFAPVPPSPPRSPALRCRSPSPSRPAVKRSHRGGTELQLPRCPAAPECPLPLRLGFPPFPPPLGPSRGR